MRVLTAQQGVGSMSGGVTLVTQQLLSLRQLTRGACSSRTHEDDCNSMHGTSIDAAAVNQCRQGLLQLALETTSTHFLENSRRDGNS